MRHTMHRSENLHIYRDDDAAEILIELRFSESASHGRCDGVCPRCGKLGKAAYWELEGPDGTQNTLWLSCNEGPNCDADSNWSKTVDFDDWRDAL